MINFTEISKFFETEFPLNKEGLKELFSLFKRSEERRVGKEC